MTPLVAPHGVATGRSRIDARTAHGSAGVRLQLTRKAPGLLLRFPPYGPPFPTASMIRVLASDFGNVLSRFSHERASQQIAALTGGRHDAAHVHRWIFGEHRLEPLESGEADPEEFLRELGSRFSIRDAGALRAAYQTIFERVETTCRLLARVSIPKLLVSNTDPIHWEEIERLFAADFAGFAPGGLLRSYALGCRKPARPFYEALIAAARRSASAPDLAPEEILFIDDLEENCVGAEACGLTAYVHRNHDARLLEQALRDHRLLG